MADSIRAVVKRYEVPEKGIEFMDYTYYPNDHQKIFERVMQITGNDYEISQDAASWCELAHEGEIYEFREGEIEIMDIPQEVL